MRRAKKKKPNRLINGMMQPLGFSHTVIDGVCVICVICCTQVHVHVQLGLPPCTWEDRLVPLSPLERHIYEEQSAKLLKALDRLRGLERAAARAAGEAAGGDEASASTKQVSELMPAGTRVDRGVTFSQGRIRCLPEPVPWLCGQGNKEGAMSFDAG